MRRRRSSPAAALTGLITAAAACSGSAPVRDQWEIFVVTDAPIPSFGQQLSVELIDDQGRLASPADRRLIDASHPSNWPISFGIVPKAGRPPPRIRAQLYRVDQLGVQAVPVGEAFLDATARLPVAHEVTRVALPLMMSCFSVMPDLAKSQSCDPTSGALAPEATLAAGADPDSGSFPAVGTWPPARPVPCRTTTPGMVCLPGGAFLLGTTQYLPSAPAEDPTPERLVELSPFELDTYEVTVGQVRDLVRKGALKSEPVLGDPGNYQADNGPCTFLGRNVSSNDAFPLNCISQVLAREVCRVLGKRLPTEAEWEYAAGNLGEKTRFPWGSDTDICAYTVIARGRNGTESQECLLADPYFVLPPGPVAGGDPLDVTELGVHDLGGNVAEWAEDSFVPYSAPCWSHATLLVDPVCHTTPSAQVSVRGGSWSFLPALASPYLRDGAGPAGWTNDVGFRCAKDG